MIEKEIRKSIVSLLLELLDEVSEDNQQSRLNFQPLFGDGSSRRFIRVFCDAKPYCLAVVPGSLQEKDLGEFRASLAIARHLRTKGVSVPEVLAVDHRIGLILFEDLGDVRLHSILKTENRETLCALYHSAIDALVNMQVNGADGFERKWCCDTETYDLAVMTERESGYFYQAFWKDTLFAEDVDGLVDEFEQLAERTMNYFEPFFLHRDFQSRNIMIKDGRVRIIDFQAARLGPPGYDIASLLIDPYASLSARQQEELFSYYLQQMSGYDGVDVNRIRASYPYLATHRNLQIIGAFAFLSGKKRKAFFNQFLLPSLIMLQNRLSEPVFDDFPVMRKTAAEAIKIFRRRFRG